MKPSLIEREKLASELRRQLEKAGLSQGQLSELAKVDPSQTSRVLDGRFVTLGGGVLRICKELGVDPQRADEPPLGASEARRRAAWARLEASMRRAWDQSPQGAERLVAVIDAVAQMQRRGSDEDDPDGSVRKADAS